MKGSGVAVLVTALLVAVGVAPATAAPTAQAAKKTCTTKKHPKVRTCTVQGPRGKTGVRGPKGDKGDAGAAGPQGAAGPAGPTGQSGPQGPAGSGGTSYPSVSATLAGPVSTTDSTAFTALGGPSVTLTVPPSGLIQVAASAIGTDDDGAVSLYQDGAQVPGQFDSALCDPDGILFGTGSGSLAPGLRWGTPAMFTLVGCFGASGAPAPVVLQAMPGTHTFELRYALLDCGCGGTTATFSDVRLFITPLP